MSMTRTRAKELLDAFTTCRPLVLGDLMLDEYLFGDVHRISPEAPVPVVHLRRESYRLGGAGNVAANAAALGARPTLLGVVGRDHAGDRFIERLAEMGIDSAGVLRSNARPTTQKSRVIAHGQQIVRYDREDTTDLSGDERAELLALARAALPRADVLILSDYAKGCLTPGLLEELLGIAAERDLPVIVDPKVRSFRRYQPVTALTPNHHEAALAAQVFDSGEDGDIERIGRLLLAQQAARMVLITRGEAGMTLVESGGPATHLVAQAREVFDVSGAGDTVCTTFALALASGGQPVEAAALANKAAGLVVGKVGTATVTPSELLAAIDG